MQWFFIYSKTRFDTRDPTCYAGTLKHIKEEYMWYLQYSGPMTGNAQRVPLNITTLDAKGEKEAMKVAVEKINDLVKNNFIPRGYKRGIQLVFISTQAKTSEDFLEELQKLEPKDPRLPGNFDPDMV